MTFLSSVWCGAGRYYSPYSAKVLLFQSMAGAFHISRVNEIIRCEIPGDITQGRQHSI